MGLRYAFGGWRNPFFGGTVSNGCVDLLIRRKLLTKTKKLGIMKLSIEAADVSSYVTQKGAEKAPLRDLWK